MIDTAHAPPNFSIHPVSHPCPPSVWTATLAANQKISQSELAAVFSLLRYCFIGYLPHTSPAGNLCLRHLKGFAVNDCRVIIRYQILCQFSAVSFHLFCDAILYICFLIDHVAAVPFVRKDTVYVPFAPYAFPLFGQIAVSFQIGFDLICGITCKVFLENLFHNVGFFGNNFRLAVLAFTIAQNIISESIRSRAHPLMDSPLDIGTDVFAFRLRHNAVKTDHHFTFHFEGI